MVTTWAKSTAQVACFVMSIVAGGWINVPIAVNCSCAEVSGVKNVKVCGWI
jgi:hypothetical protein